MKKTTTPASILALCTILFFSCSHTRTTTSFPIKLNAFVYAMATHETEMRLAKTTSIAAAGQDINIFVPYTVQGDEIHSATICWTDAATGEPIKEVALQPSTDLSVMNIKVPEELQGTHFLFAHIPVEEALSGHSINIHSKIESRWKVVEDKIDRAFRVE